MNASESSSATLPGLVAETPRLAARLRRWRWPLVGAVAAIAAAGGWVVLRRPPPLNYETGTVDKGPVIARITATGVLSALVTVQVGAQVSGQITKITVDFNSPVKKGQLITQLDPVFYQAGVDQARANWVAAKAQVDKAIVQDVDAKRQYDRTVVLKQRDLMSQADLDTAEATWRAAVAQTGTAKGQLEQAKAALKQAEVNLKYTNIYSPIDGVVISRSVDVGQTVAASLSAPTLFTIAQDLEKDAGRHHRRRGRRRASCTTGWTPPSSSTHTPTKNSRGKIRQIRNAPQTVQNVVTYDAVIDVENPDLKLKPG